MVRETRYLYVGNLPLNITETNILEHFSNYGKIQSVRMAPPIDGRPNAIIAFMDIKCASKAHSETIIIEGESVVTAYNENSSVVTLTLPPASSATIPPLVDAEKSSAEKNFIDEKQDNKNEENIIPQNDINENIKSLNLDSKLKNNSIFSKFNSFKSLKKHNSLDSSTKRSEKKLSSIVQVPEQSALSSGESTGVDCNDGRPLGMLMRGFPTRSTDSSIRDGLFHEYKKFGKVMGVQVVGQADERHAIVSFKKAEDAAKALEASYDKKFFGSKVQVYPHEGLIGRGDKRGPDDHDEYHHKATKTLFVGNLDKLTTKEFLINYFEKYGLIIDIDIKNQGQTSIYAFIQYDNIKSVVRALKELDDEYINDCKVKVGFGKSMPTTCVWLSGIPDTVSEKWLAIHHLINFGHLLALYIDRGSGRGLAYFETVEQAITAVQEMKTRMVVDKRLEVDFASRDCQNLLLDGMERSGQLRPGDRPEERLGRPPIYPLMHPTEVIHLARPAFDGMHRGSGRYYGGHEMSQQTSFRPSLFQGHGRGYFNKVDCYEPTYERRELPVLPKYYEPPTRAVDDSYENYPAYDRDGYSKDSRHSLSPEKSSYHVSSHHSIGADSPRSSGRYQSPLRSTRNSLDRDDRMRDHHRDDKYLRRSPKHRAKDSANASGAESDARYQRLHLSRLSSHRDSSTTKRRSVISDHVNIEKQRHHHRSTDGDRRRYIEVSDRSVSDAGSRDNDEVLDLEKKKQQLLEMLEAMEKDGGGTYDADEISTGSDVEIVEKHNSDIEALSVESEEDAQSSLQKKIDALLEDNRRTSIDVVQSIQSSPHKKPTRRDSRHSDYMSDDHSHDWSKKVVKGRSLRDDRKSRKARISGSSSDGSLRRLESYSPALSAGSEEMLPMLRRESAHNSQSHDSHDCIKQIPCSPLLESGSLMIDPRPPPMTIISDEYMNLPLPDYAFDLQAIRRHDREKNKALNEDNEEDYVSNLLDVSNNKPGNKSVSCSDTENIKAEEVTPAQIEEEIRGFINETQIDPNNDLKANITISTKSKVSGDEVMIKEDKDLESKEILDKKVFEKTNISVNKTKKEDTFNNLDNLSLEERIRALDEKLNMIQQGSTRISAVSTHSSSLAVDSSQTSVSSSYVLDYREKYRRHRRDPSTSTATITDQKVLEPSDSAKILLSRSSVFDQDTRRLELLNKLKQDSSNLSLDDIQRSNLDYSSTLRNMFPLSIATSWSSTWNNLGQPLSPAPTANLYPTVTPGGVVWNTLPTPVISSPQIQQKPPFDISKNSYIQTSVGQTPIGVAGNNVQISDPRKLARTANNLDLNLTSTKRTSDTTVSQSVQPNVAQYQAPIYQIPLLSDPYKSEMHTTLQKSKEVVSPLVSILKKQSSKEDATATTKSNIEVPQNIEANHKMHKKRTDSISSNSDKSAKVSSNSLLKSNQANLSLTSKANEESSFQKDSSNFSNHQLSDANLTFKSLTNQKTSNHKLNEKNLANSISKNRLQNLKVEPFFKEINNKDKEETNLNPLLSNEQEIKKSKKKDTKDSNSSVPNDIQVNQNLQKEKSKTNKSDKIENKYRRIKIELSEDIITMPVSSKEKEISEKIFKNKIQGSDKSKLEVSSKTNHNKKEPIKDLNVNESSKQQTNKIDKKPDKPMISKSKIESENKPKNNTEIKSKNSSENKIVTKSKDLIDNKSKAETDTKLKNYSEGSHKPTSQNKVQVDSSDNKSQRERKLSKSSRKDHAKVSKDNVDSLISRSNDKDVSKTKSRDSSKKSSKENKRSKDSDAQKEEERQAELKMIAEALGEEPMQYVSMYDMVKRRSCKETSKSNDESKSAEKSKTGSQSKNLASLSSESEDHTVAHLSDNSKKMPNISSTKTHLRTSSSSFDLSSDDQLRTLPPKRQKKSAEKKVHGSKLTLSTTPKIQESLSSSSSEDEAFLIKSNTKNIESEKKKNVDSKAQPQQRAKIYTSSSSSDEEPIKVEVKAISSSVKDSKKTDILSNNLKKKPKMSELKNTNKSISKKVEELKKDNLFGMSLSESSLSSSLDSENLDLKLKQKEVCKVDEFSKIKSSDKITKREKVTRKSIKDEDKANVFDDLQPSDKETLKKDVNKSSSKNEEIAKKDKTKSTKEAIKKKSSAEIVIATQKSKSKSTKLEPERRNIFEKMDFQKELKEPVKETNDLMLENLKTEVKPEVQSTDLDSKRDVKETDSDKFARWKNESSKQETIVEAVRAIIDWDQRNRTSANELEGQTSVGSDASVTPLRRTQEGMDFDESDGGNVDELNLAIRNLIGGEEEETAKMGTEIVETEIVMEEIIAEDASFQMGDNGFIVNHLNDQMLNFNTIQDIKIENTIDSMNTDVPKSEAASITAPETASIQVSEMVSTSPAVAPPIKLEESKIVLEQTIEEPVKTCEEDGLDRLENMFSPRRGEDISGMEALCRAAAAEANAAALLQPTVVQSNQLSMPSPSKKRGIEDEHAGLGPQKKSKPNADGDAIANEPSEVKSKKNEEKKVESTSQPTWQTNMDIIIDQVAKGNFERGHEFDYYSQKRQGQGKTKGNKIEESPPISSPHPVQQDSTPSPHIGHEMEGRVPMQMAPPLALLTQHGLMQVSTPGGASLQQLQMYTAGMAAARQLAAAQQQQQQLVVLSPGAKQSMRHAGINAMQPFRQNIPTQFIATSNAGLLTTVCTNMMSNTSPGVMLRMVQPHISPSHVATSMSAHQLYQLPVSAEANVRRSEEMALEKQRQQKSEQMQVSMTAMHGAGDVGQRANIVPMQMDARSFQLRPQQHYFDPQHRQFIPPDHRHARPAMHLQSLSPASSSYSPQHANIPSSLDSSHESQRLNTSQKERQQAHVRPIQLTSPLLSPNIVGQHRLPFTMVPESRSVVTTPRAEPKSQPSLVVSINEHANAIAPNIFGSCLLDGKLIQPSATPCFPVFSYGPGQPVAMHLPGGVQQQQQLEFFMAAAANNKLITPIMTTSLHMDAQRRGTTPAQMVACSSIGRPSPEHPDRGLASMLQKLPVVWQGQLALKNDCAHVQMHFVAGSKNLVGASLPENNAPLRIAQRMRLEATQLEQVSKRMMNELEYTMLLAVPIARDTVEMVTQNHNLQTFFIQYLQQKQAAGIVNIFQPNSCQAAYVVHIFPPCEFSMQNLKKLPQDIVQNLSDGGFLMVVITTC